MIVSSFETLKRGLKYFKQSKAKQRVYRQFLFHSKDSVTIPPQETQDPF